MKLSETENPSSKITIDLIKLIEQAAPQIFGSVDPVHLQQWLGRNTGAEQLVTIDLTAGSIEKEAEITAPVPPSLLPRINDVITFGDNSELRIQVLVPRGSGEDLASAAYYGLLTAISHI